jgi:hypothetical protein
MPLPGSHCVLDHGSPSFQPKKTASPLGSQQNIRHPKALILFRKSSPLFLNVAVYPKERERFCINTLYLRIHFLGLHASSHKPPRYVQIQLKVEAEPHIVPGHRSRAKAINPIEEEKYVMKNTFLSYGLHMSRSKSDARFVCRVCCVCCLKLVVDRNWWYGAGQMLASLLDGLSCVP